MLKEKDIGGNGAQHLTVWATKQKKKKEIIAIIWVLV